ncbi:S8 family serine peptidase [Solwaraspora sp. WMMA2056]|uniref:S8 family serine peptidase n=1 Tax=Solwaraspora sp. WMMA2056 TaxID=3015161 RepID=UPI00259B9F22|nr:S8 family serine peptidase [Solwaraspora sp. WMMA2056]WJK44218.1 S8 family serine peptidase [Solwaraspora sp. WMMA2056]
MHRTRRGPGRRKRSTAGGWAARTRATVTAALVALLVVTVPPVGAGAAPSTGSAGAQLSAELAATLDRQGTADFMVYLRERADLPRAATAATAGLPAGSRQADARAAAVFRELTSTAERSQQSLRELLDERKASYTPYWIANAVRVTGDRALADRIATLPEVERIDPARSYPLLTPEPATPVTGTDGAGTAAVEWNLTNVRAPQTWAEFGTRGEGIVVATIDSGVQYDHPALAASYRGADGAGGYDHDYNWFDPTGICPAGTPCDNNDHGTHVTGTITGDDGGTNQTGVAPGARWIAAKGCEVDTCSDASLLAAGQWVLAPTDSSGANPRPDLRADVVNNSWGGGQNDPWYRQTVDAWVAAGMFPAFAIGNEGPACGTASSPGDYPQAYAVGNYDVNNVIAARSSRGASLVDGAVKPNIAAPGTAIRSSVPGGGYAAFSGTSMASPHVAGTVALAWSAAPTLYGDIAATRALLDGTAIDTDDTSCGGTAANNNNFGEGRLDAYAVVEAAPRGPAGRVGGVVTGDGEPLAGATVATGERSVTSGADGSYALTLPTGEHTLTASAFGYRPVTATVTVTEDGTVTQDFDLAATTVVTLTGRVTDGSGHGWPLYARVEVDGQPDTLTYTDPASGRYTLTVPGDTAVALLVTPVLTGYQPARVDVPAGASDRTVNVRVGVTAACVTPGYAASFGAPLLAEDFSADTAPDGWSVVERTAGGGWDFTDIGSRGNLTGGDGGFANIDSDALGVGQTQDTDLVTPTLDMSGTDAPYLRFASDWRAVGLSDSAEVGVSVDGGDTWTTVWRQTSSRRGPRVEEIPLTEVAGAAQVLVRFRFQGTYAWWWQVDDVEVVDRSCTPLPGGLLVGTTTDHNTGAALNGVTVAAVADPTVAAVSAATPADPTQPDGFYQLFSPLTGEQEFTATRAPYQVRSRTVTVVPDGARRADFSVKAGRVTLSPTTPVVSHQPYGSTRKASVTVTNTGSAPATVEMLPSGGDFDLLGTAAGAALTEHRVKGISKAWQGQAYGAPAGAAPTRISPAPAAGSAAGSAADEAWTRAPDHPTAVFDNAAATLDGKIYSVAGGSTTGTERDAWVYDPVTDAWSALPDLPVARSKPVLAAVGGKLYLFGGWGAGGTPVASVDMFDPATGAWSTLPGVTSPAPRAAAGSAVVGSTVYLIGGCVDGTCTDSRTVLAFDTGTGTFRSRADYPLAASWLACGGIGDRAYCAGGAGAVEYRSAYAYDPAADAWSPLPDLPLDLWGGQYAAAGGLLVIAGGVTGSSTTVTNRTVGFDPTAGVWRDLPNTQFARYRGAGACGAYKIGGSPTSFVGSPQVELLNGLASCDAAADIPWLDPAPGSFTLAPGASRTVTVTLSATAEAGVDQPGRYTATLGLRSNTPYPVGAVDVQMNVSPPASWAKVQGTVSGLSCAGVEVGIAGATVRLNSLTEPGTGFTLRTDATGGFAYWLPRGQYQIITAKDGWVPQAHEHRLPAGIVTTVDTLLEQVDPCPPRLGGV